MKSKTHFSQVKIVLAFAALLLWAAPLFALEAPHDSSNSVDCADCHAMHAAGSGPTGGTGGVTTVDLLYRSAEQERVCQNCHFPGEPAQLFVNFALHVNNLDAEVADCGMCHDPHQWSAATSGHGFPAQDNVRLIRSTPKYMGAVAVNNIYYDSAEVTTFGFSTGTADGMCQACHTTTSYWLADQSEAVVHNEGANCLLCHEHVDGFKPASCVDCHNAAQDNLDGAPVGGRRAMVAEFPTAVGANGHMAATGAGATAVVGADCIICHDTSNHSIGNVEVYNMDDSAVVFSFSLATGYAKGAASDISDFCMTCHDANGAADIDDIIGDVAGDPADPFGSGTAPLNIFKKLSGAETYTEAYGNAECFGTEGTGRAVNTRHDIRGDDQTTSGAQVECLNCHGAHSVNDVEPRAVPTDNTQVWTGTANEFCLVCHWGGDDAATPLFPVDAKIAGAGNQSMNAVSGPTVELRGLESCGYNTADTWVSYTWTNSAHGVDSKRAWAGYNSGGATYEVACADCHDSHGSSNPGAGGTRGNLYMIKDAVDGTGYQGDGYRLDPTFPNLAAVAVTGTVDIDKGADLGGGVYNPSFDSLCQRCHEPVATLDNNDWWHATCTGCQACHSHGYDFENFDWPGDGAESTDCSLCGNGVVDGNEVCDPAVQAPPVSGDGCNAGCSTINE